MLSRAVRTERGGRGPRAGKLDLVEASSARSSEQHALDDPAERAAQQERLRALARELDGDPERVREVLVELKARADLWPK